MSFLSRAAELSADEVERGRRLLAAAEAALTAGQPRRADALLAEATPRLGAPLPRAQARRLHGRIRFALGHADEAAPVILEAARALAPADTPGARQALIEAVEAAMYAGWSASKAVVSEIADAVRMTSATAGPQALVTDLLLNGFAARAAAGYPTAAPLLRRAIAMLGTDDLSPADGLSELWLGCLAAAELFDDQAQHALALRWVQLARDYGALTALPVALNFQSTFAEVAAGRFDAAAACLAEAAEISAATGNPGVFGTAGVSETFELVWRGRETDARRVAAAVAREAAAAGRGGQQNWVQYCLAVLELGLGSYQAALRCALDVYEDDAPFLGTLALPDLIEAAARCGEVQLADSALGRARRAGARGRHAAGARAARPVPGPARQRRRR